MVDVYLKMLIGKRVIFRPAGHAPEVGVMRGLGEGTVEMQINTARGVRVRTYNFAHIETIELAEQVVVSPTGGLSKNDIESRVAEIMRLNGPDGHTDGAEVIAEYICALIRGRGEEWMAQWRARVVE